MGAQHLMEGSYNTILQSTAPAPIFQFLVHQLSSTVANAIAECAESAYRKISFAAGARLFKLRSEQQFVELAAQRNWNIDRANKTVCMDPTGAHDNQLPALEIISQSLGYAKELERIV